MQLWSVQIGERTATREGDDGIRQVLAAPLLALHRRRTVTFADRDLAEAVLQRLYPRFPDARLRPFPGGPEDCLVLEHSAGATEFLTAYGLGHRKEPHTPAGRQLFDWARRPGAPSDMPQEAAAAARTDAGLLAALQQGLAEGQLNPARAYAAIGAVGRPEGLDFLAWAVNAEDDFEFGAKYGFASREQTLQGIRALAADVAVEFSRRALWGRDHLYPWPVVEACVERLVRLGEPGLAALQELKQGHRLQEHIERWTEQYLRRKAGARPGREQG